MNNPETSLKVKLEAALKDAMRQGDELRKRTLRQAIAAIRQVEVDKGAALDEAGMLAVLQKEVKTRREVIEDARRAGRPQAEAEALAEIGVLEAFLPQQLSAEELEAMARAAIAEVGASSLREMGQVMKILLPRLQGRASNDQASQVVRRLLS